MPSDFSGYGKLVNLVDHYIILYLNIYVPKFTSIRSAIYCPDILQYQVANLICHDIVVTFKLSSISVQ